MNKPAMQVKNVLIVLFCLSMAIYSPAQEAPWNNRKCAVVLTYDDALNVHLDNAVPLLDSLGLKATFYLSGSSGVLNKRLPEWRALAIKGHELGNHTLFHPCLGNRPGRGFVIPEYDLGSYSIRRITDEIKMTNTLLNALDGTTKRTFAFPCGDTRVGDSSYLSSISNQFVAARGVQGKIESIDSVDLDNVGCYTISGQSGDELVALVKTAMNSHKLIVFLFHGVGGEHGLNVSLPAHRQLLQFLKVNAPNIWVAPMVEVATYIKVRRSGLKQ